MLLASIVNVLVPVPAPVDVTGFGENWYAAPDVRPDRLSEYGLWAAAPVKLIVYTAWFPWDTNCDTGVTVTVTAAWTFVGSVTARTIKLRMNSILEYFMAFPTLSDCT